MYAHRACHARFLLFAIVVITGIGMNPPVAAAQRVILDFEGLKGMTFWSRSPIPSESRLSDAFLKNRI